MYVHFRRSAFSFLDPIRFAIFLIILSVAGVTLAAERNQLDGLINLALKNNPEISMARYQSMAAQAKIDPVQQLPDPQLKVSAMNVPTNFSFTSQTMTMAPDISLMQMLPWFGKLSAAGDVQKYSYESAADRLHGITLDVVAQIKKVYGSIYSTEKTIRYLKYKEQLLQKVVKVAEQLFAVGQVPQQDVFRATAELTLVRTSIIETQAMLEKLEANLGDLLGLNRPYSVTVDTLDFPHLAPLESLEGSMIELNPDLKQIKNVELAAQAKTVLAKKAAIPDLSAGISYGYRGALMPNGTKALDMMSFEVGMSIPIFFGSKQQKIIDEAEFMNKAADQQYGTVQLALFSRLRSTYADAVANTKLIPLYAKELIPQYEATYNSSLSSYSVGKTTFAMLIDNLTTLINTRIAYVKIESSYFSDLAQISRLVGEGAENYRGER